MLLYDICKKLKTFFAKENNPYTNTMQIIMARPSRMRLRTDSFFCDILSFIQEKKIYLFKNKLKCVSNYIFANVEARCHYVWCRAMSLS